MAGRTGRKRTSARRSWSWRFDADWPPPSSPIPVENGLKAKSARGQIGDTWWSQRFVGVIEALLDPDRMARGRRYARLGQVRSIDVLEEGTVLAEVQGSRPRPYDVTISLKPLSEVEWRRVTEAMAGQAIFAARLLAGEVPSEIEEAFAAAGVTLFPRQRGDLQMGCSCPDSASPCKHIAAVYYLLAEQFDQEPFLLFGWRGRSKERLMAELRELRSPEDGVPEPSDTPEEEPLADGTPESELAPKSEPEPEAAFWDSPAFTPEHLPDRPPPGSADLLLRELPVEASAALSPMGVEFLRSCYRIAATAARTGRNS
jgi:uncharacterized Zn finger protein